MGKPGNSITIESPADTKGAIVAGADAFNYLIMAATTDVDNIPHIPASSKGTIFAYNGKGWQVLYQTAAGEDIKAIHVSSAYDTFRLWAVGRTSTQYNGYYIDLPVDRSNPSQVTGRDYAVTSTHYTPHFRVGNDVTGIALSVQAEVEGATANETTIIGYDINRSGSFTDFATITSNGITEFPFPNATSPSGTEFRSIQFRVVLARGGTTTLTPDLRSLTFKFDKVLEERWTHSVTLDLSGKGPQGLSPRAQWNNLRTSLIKKSLLEFTTKDDSNATSTRRHWVRAKMPDKEEETGEDYKGEARLILVEPQHLN